VKNAWEHPMLDVILLALGLIFFVLSIGYAYACDQL
jgi:SNF family Na+-dependent transporter